MDAFKDRFSKFLSALKKKLPEDRYSESIIDRTLYSRDYWPLQVFREARGAKLERPRLIIHPRNTDEVSFVLRQASKYGIPVIPYGGGSGVVGGATPLENSIVIDVSGLNHIGEIDLENHILEVGGGVVIQTLEEALNRKGFTLRHIPQSYPEAEIGGLIATRSVGQYSSKYGGIEDLVMAIEAVLPDGTIINTKKVPRRSVGPSMRDLFIGSEGIFGIVTKATLKVRPIPTIVRKAAYVFRSFIEGIQAVREVVQRDIFPPVVRLYDEDEVSLRFSGDQELRGKSLLILIFEGYDDRVDLEVKYADSILGDYGERMDERFVDDWLRSRFNVIGEISKLLQIGGIYDTIEISGLWSSIPEIYIDVKKNVFSIEGILVVMSHLSHVYRHGGCLYFTVGGIPPDGVDIEDFFTSFWDKVLKSTLKHRGSISHHHGVGLMRVRWMEEEHGNCLELVRKIKKSLDPKGIMNPGKLVGDVG